MHYFSNLIAKEAFELQPCNRAGNLWQYPSIGQVCSAARPIDNHLNSNDQVNALHLDFHTPYGFWHQWKIFVNVNQGRFKDNIAIEPISDMKDANSKYCRSS